MGVSNAVGVSSVTHHRVCAAQQRAHKRRSFAAATDKAFLWLRLQRLHAVCGSRRPSPQSVASPSIFLLSGSTRSVGTATAALPPLAAVVW